MIAQYITSAEICAYECQGWTVEQLIGHHGRFYLAWKPD